MNFLKGLNQLIEMWYKLPVSRDDLTSRKKQTSYKGDTDFVHRRDNFLHS